MKNHELTCECSWIREHTDIRVSSTQFSLPRLVNLAVETAVERNRYPAHHHFLNCKQGDSLRAPNTVYSADIRSNGTLCDQE